MGERACKTLEAYLLQPTQWKATKLHEQQSVYLKALHEAFEASAHTRSQVNDIVTPYENLAWQAKDALKNHVPDLLDEESHGARQLKEYHPIRYTNRAAQFERDRDRTHELCWRVPMPGRGTSFWIPLQINPDQEKLWHALAAGDDWLDAGQVRLQRESDQWVLHVTVKFDMSSELSLDDTNYTPIGIDIGISQLLVGCALEDGCPDDPFLYSGNVVRNVRQLQDSADQRLQRRDATTLNGTLKRRYQRRIDAEIETATRKVVDYATGYECPVIVMEDLTGIREGLDSKWVHQWAFAQLQTRIEEKAQEQSIPVVSVPANYTSQICHCCNRLGSRPKQAEFRCPYNDCWVSEFHADINAAANIAQRLDPWGESLPWKPGGDDMPRKGAPVTEPQDTAESEAHLSEMRAADDNIQSSMSGSTGTGQMTSDTHTS